MEATAANGHDLTPEAELLHGEEEVVYADAAIKQQVRLSEDQAAGHDQESVQGECAGRTDQPVFGPTPTAADQLNKGSVCPMGTDQGE